MLYDFIFNSCELIIPECQVVAVATTTMSDALGDEAKTDISIATNITLNFGSDINISFYLDYKSEIGTRMSKNEQLELMNSILTLNFQPNFIPYYAPKEVFSFDGFGEINIGSELEVELLCSNNSNSVKAVEREGIQLKPINESMNEAVLSKDYIVSTLLPNLELLLTGTTFDKQNGKIITLNDTANEQSKKHILVMQELIEKTIRVEAGKHILL